LLIRSSVDLWFNNIFEFDPASMKWKNFGRKTGGTPPAPSKDSQAFTSLGGKLYRFGGLGFQGSCPDIVIIFEELSTIFLQV
jgi:hypothetical protein